MSDDLEADNAALWRVNANLARARERADAALAAFARDMRARGIHIGIGTTKPLCVTCGEPWPCSAERDDRESAT